MHSSNAYNSTKQTPNSFKDKMSFLYMTDTDDTSSENKYAQLHIPLLRAFDELQFMLGKVTFITYIKGDLNPTIEKHNLDEINSYGCLFKEDRDLITSLVEQLIKGEYLEEAQKGYYKVLQRTPKGLKELFERKFEYKEESAKSHSQLKTNLLKEEEVTDEDRVIFKQFDFFLGKFNSEQKKAIVSQRENILCMAGAGSGKTTVLTKRIEFLTKFRGVKANKVLAITFTKKAKEEMQHRLFELGLNEIKVETFNSFAEKQLKKHGSLLYSKPTKVITFRDKIAITRSIMQKNSIHFETIKDQYFTRKQLRERSNDELFFLFIRDVFAILDYFKNKTEEITKFHDLENNPTKKRVAQAMHIIVTKLNSELKEKGLRDFSDQIIDCNTLFSHFKNCIPEFEHVLVDEFQDINSPQLDMIKLLHSPNLFAVGDPRQAIYGWRGSEIEYILQFPKTFENTQIIALKTNYRSDPNLVDFFNHSIKEMKLPNLIAGQDKNKEENNIFLIEQASEKVEQIFVLEAIKNSKTKLEEIFILGRTNKVLEKYSELLEQQGIEHSIKVDDSKGAEQRAPVRGVTLATIHSIKGMEAEEVYLVSCNSLSYPNKVQDNFVFDLVKQSDNYNKQDEELRLFYVALSRAKHKLIITYTGNRSKFINSYMIKYAQVKEQNKSLFSYAKPKSSSLSSGNSHVLASMLKEWRLEKAQTLGGLPAYMILSNAAIEGLAEVRPSSKGEMYQINGLGESKIAKYGEEILRVING
jgi:superfamily I DNA/RNA helicase